MSTQKTTKAYTKRIKVTKNGKLKVRAKRQNHYNAKESSQKKIQKRRAADFTVIAKTRARFMPHN